MSDYILITRDMLALGLRGSKLLVYALIHGFSKDGESDFHGSSTYVADWCGISKPQALEILKQMTAEGLLTRDDSSRLPSYRIAADRKTDRSENQPQRSENRPKGSENRPRTDNTIDNTIDNTNTYSAPRARDGHRYGDKVIMSPDEYDKLVARFGDSDARRLVEILDNYLINHPQKRYASHYRAILSWCVRELNEQKLAEQRLSNAQHVSKPATPQTYTTYQDSMKRLAEIEAKYKK